MDNRLALVLIASITAFVACERRNETSQPRATIAPSAPSATASAIGGGLTPSVSALMQDHFTQATTMRDAVIRGDLQAARAAAKVLATREIAKDLPDDWRSHVAALRSAASAGVDAPSLDAIALVVGDVANACGGCHGALGGPKFAPGEPPGPASGAAAHMARHVWAESRMWEGLVGPSEASWVKGTEAFSDAPLLTKQGDKPLDALAKRVHALGERGRALVEDRKLSSPQASPLARQRSATYGEMLATCSQCHQKSGKGPGASPAP